MTKSELLKLNFPNIIIDYWEQTYTLSLLKNKNKLRDGNPNSWDNRIIFSFKDKIYNTSYRICLAWKSRSFDLQKYHHYSGNNFEIDPLELNQEEYISYLKMLVFA